MIYIFMFLKFKNMVFILLLISLWCIIEAIWEWMSSGVLSGLQN